jgi:dTDP-4-amino-4,6-dideoxygalactose transaminase
MENIQVFIPTFRIEETLEEIRICLEKGWTGLGFKTVEFEDAWRDYTGLSHAHFLNSATAGLELAVQILKHDEGWQDGDEIISTPLTFVSSNHAIRHAGLKVVFADVDEYLTLDPASVAERITPRTRAVMFVGLGGNTGSYREVLEICREHNLRMILDAAHMAGTRVAGQHIGQDADVAIFSFQAVKNLPTADSGMICFAKEELDEAARKWSWLGINKDTYARTTSQGTYKWYYDVEYPGFKAHGNSIMAAIGLVALRYLDQDNAYRRQVAQWYSNLLADEPAIKSIPVREGCESSRHLYQVMVAHRDEVMLGLNQHGIFPGVHYRDNIQYNMYSYADGSCPNARQASDSIMTLPMHLQLGYKDVVRITEALKSIVRLRQSR